ncbi:UNVERIFIED_CONTAM: Multicystatin [Sesamum angustifolium]|uniref:Cysteine proteinase inhibitor n=1 Tax=Sesamum angustifolium TaxID=2727405 RepID=A0AAW2QQN3_9LAMI
MGTPGGIHPVDISPDQQSCSFLSPRTQQEICFYSAHSSPISLLLRSYKSLADARMFLVVDFENMLLEFKKVLSAKEHVVGGFSYYITLETADGEKNKVYEAQEFVKDWENVKEVQKFKLVGDLYQIYGTGRNMMQS